MQRVFWSMLFFLENKITGVRKIKATVFLLLDARNLIHPRTFQNVSVEEINLSPDIRRKAPRFPRNINSMTRRRKKKTQCCVKVADEERGSGNPITQGCRAGFTTSSQFDYTRKIINARDLSKMQCKKSCFPGENYTACPWARTFQNWLWCVVIWARSGGNADGKVGSEFFFQRSKIFLSRKKRALVTSQNVFLN